MNTPAPTLTPAQTLERAIRERYAVGTVTDNDESTFRYAPSGPLAKMIAAQYRPLLKQARDALAECFQQLHDQQAIPDESGDATYSAAIVALNHAL